MLKRQATGGERRYSAAVGRRFDAVCVSGYFGPREQLWQEPIYRNVFGLLREALASFALAIGGLLVYTALLIAAGLFDFQRRGA